MIGLLLGAAVLSRLTDLLGLGQGASITFMVAFVFAMIAISIASVIVVHRNYSRTLFGDQGYLMRTLPVSNWKTYLSKILITLFWFHVILLSVLIAAFVLSGISFNDADMISLRKIFSWTGIQRFFTLILPQWIIVLLGLSFSVQCLYTYTTVSNISLGGRRVGKLLGLVTAVVLFVAANFFADKFLPLLIGEWELLYSLNDSHYFWYNAVESSYFWDAMTANSGDLSSFSYFNVFHVNNVITYTLFNVLAALLNLWGLGRSDME